MINSPSDIGFEMTAQDERALIRHQTEPYNFLKHADRDPLASIDEADVDARGVIIAAISAYSMVFPAEGLPADIDRFLRNEGVRE